MFLWRRKENTCLSTGLCHHLYQKFAPLIKLPGAAWILLISFQIFSTKHHETFSFCLLLFPFPSALFVPFIFWAFFSSLKHFSIESYYSFTRMWFSFHQQGEEGKEKVLGEKNPVKDCLSEGYQHISRQHRGK